MDDSGAAITKLRELSLADFGNSAPSIGGDGTINAK